MVAEPEMVSAVDQFTAVKGRREALIRIGNALGADDTNI